MVAGSTLVRLPPPKFNSSNVELQWDFQAPPRTWDPPYGKRDPYYSHSTPIRIPKDMGIVWDPLTIRGLTISMVPGITLDSGVVPPKTNMEPKNTPLFQGETSTQTTNFWVPAVSFRGCKLQGCYSQNPKRC